MPFARLRRLFHTLRFRLTAWNTGTILVLTIATLLGVREGLRIALFSELDQRLSQDVGEVRLLLERFDPGSTPVGESLNRKALAREASSWFVEVFAADGRPLRAAGPAPAIGVPAAHPAARAVTAG